MNADVARLAILKYNFFATTVVVRMVPTELGIFGPLRDHGEHFGPLFLDEGFDLVDKVDILNEILPIYLGQAIAELGYDGTIYLVRYGVRTPSAVRCI